MKLEDYLKELETCPDVALKFKLGVYDNFPIILNANFEKVIKDLLDAKNFKLEKESGEEDKRYYIDYVPGTVKLRVLNYFGYFAPGFWCYETEEQSKLFQKQLKNYNMVIILDSTQRKKIPKTSNLRALASVIRDIGEYIIEKRISAFLPHTSWWYGPEDGSRVVYHNPNETLPTIRK